eukprot:1400079-Pleurochrysis_carterae.AAC.1
MNDEDKAASPSAGASNGAAKSGFDGGAQGDAALALPSTPRRATSTPPSRKDVRSKSSAAAVGIIDEDDEDDEGDDEEEGVLVIVQVPQREVRDARARCYAPRASRNVAALALTMLPSEEQRF